MDRMTDKTQFRLFMKWVAIGGGALVLVGLVLTLAGVHCSDALLEMGFGSLSIVAIFMGQLFPYTSNDGDASQKARLQPIWKFAMTCTGYATATILLGALFAILHWSEGMAILLAGLAGLAVCALAWVFYLVQRNKQ